MWHKKHELLKEKKSDKFSLIKLGKFQVAKRSHNQSEKKSQIWDISNIYNQTISILNIQRTPTSQHKNKNIIEK